ncbi:hypothetical protein GUJ93_ZPchr0002g26537, partial [Zizania palustris]
VFDPKDRKASSRGSMGSELTAKIAMLDLNPKGANIEDRVATDIEDDPLTATRQVDPDVSALCHFALKKINFY